MCPISNSAIPLHPTVSILPRAMDLILIEGAD